MSYASRDSAVLAVNSPSQSFGGVWTSEKLETLQRYLRAYTKVFQNQAFLRPIYIDAFAGSGYMTRDSGALQTTAQLSLLDFRDEAADRLVQGSASLALQTEVPFRRYYFIEQKKKNVRDLERLKQQYPDRANSILIERGDANGLLLKLCRNLNWKQYRALLFLDPYGMQVEWKTLEAIVKTEAIDVWYLFPLGVAISRLLRKDGRIEQTNKNKLTAIFGTSAWEEVFYPDSEQLDLFSGDNKKVRDADFDRIEQFFIARLKTIFPKVAPNPRRLLNSRRNPLYSLCFAAGNPGKGGEIALKIAMQVLGKN